MGVTLAWITSHTSISIFGSHVVVAQTRSGMWELHKHGLLVTQVYLSLVPRDVVVAETRTEM